MELRDYIRILRKNWIMIIAVMLVGIGVAAVYSLTRTPMYTSTSEVMISSQAGSTIGEQQQGNTYTQARVASYVQLAKTPKVLDTVISELSIDSTAADLAESVTVTNPTGTTIIEIAADDASAAQAAEIANSVAESLTNAVVEVETIQGSDAAPVKITQVTPALAPESPSSPNVPMNLALGLLVGLAIGVAAAVLRSVLDTRIRSTREVEEITDKPIIGSIPFDPKAEERPIILASDPRDPRSEAFRTLRTNLQFIDLNGGRTFVITSSMPSEGKSTTAANLAIALADSGKRVVLIDADLRKPKVATYLGIEGGVGLTDLLIGRAEAADVVQRWGQRSLYVLPAGKTPPNPSELLGSSRMQRVLETLASNADMVIIDAPPILPVTDAAILARETSGTIVSVAAGKTHKQQLTAALASLENVSAPIAGLVMNMVPTRGADAPEYGYGYGTYAEEPEVAPRRRRRERAAR